MIELNKDVLSDDGRKAISVKENPQIGTWGLFDRTVIEAPVYLGRCQIEAERIGAFTQINMGKVLSPSTNCRIEAKSVGRYCSIAHNVNVGMGGHSTSFLSTSTLFKFNGNAREAFFPFLESEKRDEEWEKGMAEKNFSSWKKPMPVIGNDVWLGFGVTVLNDVTIGDGAVVAAGSVVTKDIAPYEIWGGYLQS